MAGKPRKRIDIPEDLYTELDKDARWLHIPAQTLATMLISQGINRNREMAYLPSRPTGGLCTEGVHDFRYEEDDTFTCSKCGLKLSPIG